MSQHPIETGSSDDAHATPRVSSGPTGGPASKGSGMSQEGWVKDYRQLLDWPWFKQPLVAHFWEYCRLKASHSPHDIIVGMTHVHLEPGQFVFGRNRATAETGISPQSLRTALAQLMRAGCIKSVTHPTNHFSIVTICNWSLYQHPANGINQPINQPPTSRQPATNQPPTTNKNVENGKNEKNTFPPDKPAGAESGESKKTREPDPIWDAVVALFKINPVTKSERTRVGRIVADLKLKNATPAEIGVRIGRYRKVWPTVSCTMEALVKHWDAFAVDPPPQVKPRPLTGLERAMERTRATQQEQADLKQQAEEVF